MISKGLTIILGLAILNLNSCTSNKTEDKTQKSTFIFNSDQKADVKWTAFKTNDKLPVGGTFNVVNLAGLNEAESLADLLPTISFSIPVATTNTTNPERDAKIVASFFGAMENTVNISGKIKKASGNDESGKCTVLLKLNNIEKDQELTYEYDGQKIILSGELNLIRFGGEKAIKSLNEVCKLLHAGPDGISKTWSTVDLEIGLEIGKK